MDELLRRRSTMGAGKPSRLPVGFQEVEYIALSGVGPYINTEFTPTKGCGLEYKGSNVQSETRYANANRAFGVQYAFVSIYGWYRYEYGIQMRPLSSNAPTYTIPTSDVVEINAHATSYKLTHNGTLFSYTTSNQANFTCASTLPIFGFWQNSSGFEGRGEQGSKLYYYRLYNASNALIRDFVPCYRESDGAVGLYDLQGTVCSLTETPFFTNANFDTSETFIAGPNI